RSCPQTRFRRKTGDAFRRGGSRARSCDRLRPDACDFVFIYIVNYVFSIFRPLELMATIVCPGAGFVWDIVQTADFATLQTYDRDFCRFRWIGPVKSCQSLIVRGDPSGVHEILGDLGGRAAFDV